MTICPIAIAASCEKCPMFKVCPAKSVIGDFSEEKERDADTRQDDSGK